MPGLSLIVGRTGHLIQSNELSIHYPRYYLLPCTILVFILLMATTFQLKIRNARHPSSRRVKIIVSLGHGLPILHLSCALPRLLDRNPDHLYDV